MSMIGIEDSGAVRHLVLQRAEKRNAFNADLIAGLGGALEEAAADSSVRVVVVRGDGAMFSSGMDLNDLRELSENPGDLRPFRRRILSWSTSRSTTSYPDCAATCAMPWPIRPPPTTPTFLISI